VVTTRPLTAEQRLAELEQELRRRPWLRQRRATQRPPQGDWVTWLAMAGRGWGKTRTGAEWIHDRVEDGARRIALVGRTEADVRDVMVEGESGLLATAPPDAMPLWIPSKRRLVWPNGARATVYSSNKPDLLRGPQHDTAWADEIAAWIHPTGTWDNLMFGLRLGAHPRVVATSTPKPIRLIRDLITEPTTHITRGSTTENLQNLSAFYRTIIRRYEGTRLGRQELEGELLDDVPGALLTREAITQAVAPEPDQRRRVAISLDPAVGDDDHAALMGIVVGALGWDGVGYVLADHSRRMSPAETARLVVEIFDTYEADTVIVEANNGGDWIPALLRTERRTLPIKVVKASRGKQARAEPIASLYEKGWIVHAPATWPAGAPYPLEELEDQWCTWVAGEGASPDRIDADTWLWTHLQPDGRAREKPTRDRADEAAKASTSTGAPVTGGMLNRDW